MIERLPLISVVVPVYNTEAYLEQCVDSLIAQTYPKLEILLVDDGSTDGSAALCDRLSNTYKQVRVFHKENGGAAAARNFGVHEAQGEWVSFIDSDDYISPIYIEMLYDAAHVTGCSLACVPGGTEFFDGEACDLIEDRTSVAAAVEYDSKNFVRMILYQQVTTGAQWRLYRRDILGDGPFPIGVAIGEDLACMYKIVFQAGRVALVNCYGLYAYRHRRDSLIRQDFRPNKAISVLKVSAQLYDGASAIWPDLAAAVASRCFSICRTVFAQIPSDGNSSEEIVHLQSELWNVIRRHRKTVLIDKHARRRERLAAAIACLGMEPFTVFCHACRRLGLMQ